MIGQTVSHYKILEEIGAGGMGIVYKAEDTKLKRMVALKFLPPEFTRDKDAKDRFLHEARAAAALDHPHICTVHEINETEDGRVFIAMAHYQGETLKEQIDKGPIPQDRALDIVSQVAQGLNKAHEKEMVHRDIKPANIMITDDGVVKILDFGLAKLRGQTRLTREGTTIGTVAYMSPEQTTGGEIDHRTDIWSLGVVFYEMLTGQLPFPGHYEQAIVYSILNEEPQSLTESLPGSPPALEQIFGRMLAKDVGERYSDVNGLLEDLEQLKKGSPLNEISVKPESRPGGLQRFLPAVLVILAVILVTGYLMFRSKEKPEIPLVEPGKKPSLAVLYFENDSGDQTLDVWRYGLAKLLISDLSQSRYLDVLSTDQLHSILTRLKLDQAKNYTTENLLEIGKQAGVDLVLTSSFMKVGDTIAITAQLKDLADNRVVHAFRLTARGENEIFARVDDMTREIKVRMDLTQKQLNSDIDRSIVDVTTSNLEALKYYIEAEQHHFSGKMGSNELAREALVKAIELDPEFAMAHSILGALYANRGKYKDSAFHKRRAMELRSHLPENERHFIEADFYTINEEYDRAIASLKKMLEVYPDHDNARHRLIYIYARFREYNRCLEQLAKYKKKSPIYYRTLGSIYTWMKEYKLAREAMERYLEKPGNFQIYARRLAGTLIVERKFNEAEDLIQEGLKKLAPESHWGLRVNYQSLLGQIALFENNPERAIDIFRQIVKDYPKTENWMEGFIEEVYRHQGRFQEALALMDKDWAYQEKPNPVDTAYYETASKKIGILNRKGLLYLNTGNAAGALKLFIQAESLIPSREVWYKQAYNMLYREILFLKILAQLKLGDITRVEALVQEFRKTIPDFLLRSFPRNYLRGDLLFLEGCVDLSKGDFKNAVAKIEKTVSFLHGEMVYAPENDGLYFYFLADAYEKANIRTKAIETYENLLRLTVNRRQVGELYSRSYYRLGALYTQIEKKQKAVENYKKFIHLWKQCDPDFRFMVENARQRVTELGNSL